MKNHYLVVSQNQFVTFCLFPERPITFYNEIVQSFNNVRCMYMYILMTCLRIQYLPNICSKEKTGLSNRKPLAC